MKIAVIGGGAAGFFAAISIKSHCPSADVVIYESSAVTLSKVKISGGGRCNVTHGLFDLKQFVQNYPRGYRELLGPLHHFGPKETIDWFKARGVKLKREDDGRMFPVTDSSQTVIDCLMGEVKKLGIELITRAKITAIHPGFELQFKGRDNERVDRVVLATGSNPAGWKMAENLGHTIVPPVPSLFTFNVAHFELADLAGISVQEAIVRYKKWEMRGPVLITHVGFSGPAILKLSAFGAREMAKCDYQFPLTINWSVGEAPLPKRLKKRLEHPEKAIYQVNGKATYKSEFVTCGGIELSEVNFKTMESKVCPNLFFCGEVLDIDGVTGGFNFQNAWTTGHLIGRQHGLL